MLDMMSRSLPPLNSLCAFEAAARHLSFTQAAKELNVTQAAVSHQIKALESFMGKPLFVRLTRQLVLTPEGRMLLPAVKDCFTDLKRVTEVIKDSQFTTTLNVRVGPSFSANWLAPRLSAFWKTFPHIELSLKHSNQLVDFSRDTVDLAISWGSGQWENVKVEYLMTLEFFPVCSPSLLDDVTGTLALNKLQNFLLLHDGDHQGWARWLSMMSVDNYNLHRGVIMDDSNVLIQAAIDGQGIALGSSALVSDYLESGQLIKPFDEVMESDLAYYLVYPERNMRIPSVQDFRDWVLQQANQIS